MSETPSSPAPSSGYEEYERTFHFDKDIILDSIPCKTQPGARSRVVQEYNSEVGNFDKSFVENIQLSPTVQFQHGKELQEEARRAVRENEPGSEGGDFKHPNFENFSNERSRQFIIKKRRKGEFACKKILIHASLMRFCGLQLLFSKCISKLRNSRSK